MDEILRQAQDIELSVMPVTSFYSNRGEVLNRILRGDIGVVLERYSRPVALLMPVPESLVELIKQKMDSGETFKLGGTSPVTEGEER